MSNTWRRVGRGALFGAATGLGIWLMAGQGDMAKLGVTIVACSAFLAAIWAVKD